MKIGVLCSDDTIIDKTHERYASSLGAKFAQEGYSISTMALPIGFAKLSVDHFLIAKPKSLRARHIPFYRSTKEFYRSCDVMIGTPGGTKTMSDMAKCVVEKDLYPNVCPDIIFLNIEGFWNGFLQHTKDLVKLGFFSGKVEDLIQVANDVDDVMKLLELKQNPKLEENSPRNEVHTEQDCCNRYLDDDTPALTGKKNQSSTATSSKLPSTPTAKPIVKKLDTEELRAAVTRILEGSKSHKQDETERFSISHIIGLRSQITPPNIITRPATAQDFGLQPQPKVTISDACKAQLGRKNSRASRVNSQIPKNHKQNMR